MAREQKQHRDYWIGEVFFSQGHAWGVDEQLDTIWLGAEEDILPVLEGDKALPDTLSPKQRTSLIQLMELMEVRYARATEIRGSRSIRSRPVGVIRHRQKHAGRPKARKGVPAVRLTARTRVYLAKDVLGWLEQRSKS